MHLNVILLCDAEESLDVVVDMLIQHILRVLYI